MIEIVPEPLVFRSALTPIRGFSRSSLWTPSPSVTTSMLTSHRSCWRLKLSRNVTHFSRGMSRLGTARSSNSRGKRLRDFAARSSDALEGLDGPRFVEVQHGVELIGQSRMEVMAHALGFRPVDDADRPLEARLAQALHGSAAAQSQHEAADAYLVKELFVAARQTRAHALVLRRRIPIRSRGHRAMMGGEADEHRFAGIPFAHELTDVELAAFADLGCTRVAQVRVVLPDHDLRFASAALEVRGQRFQRLRHMRIASVPGFHAATKHRTVIFFGVFHEPSVLLGEEEFVVGDAAVAARVRNGTLLQLDQLPEHF